tara:strand:- start:1111 stop:2085 length:975 start_codon:yes stop_codon:yes gene_type:complete
MNKNNSIDKDVIKSIKKKGIGIKKISQIEKGINSRVFCLETHIEKFILKFYPSKDIIHSHDRLNAEIKFLDFLKSLGHQNVPKPLYWDTKNNWSLLTFLDGEEIKVVNDEVINSIIIFFEKLYSYKNHPKAKNLQNASEACFSFSDHFRLIEKRLDRIQKFIAEENLYSDINEWIDDILRKDLANLQNNLKSECNLKLFKEKISDRERILSASDVGIHNMLMDNDKFYFLDFEYSGWDDVSKYCSDWLLRPNQKFEINCKKILINKIKKVINSNSFLDRLEYMLPLYKIKWILIIFNGIYKDNKKITDIFERAKDYYYDSPNFT